MNAVLKLPSGDSDLVVKVFSSGVNKKKRSFILSESDFAFVCVLSSFTTVSYQVEEKEKRIFSLSRSLSRRSVTSPLLEGRCIRQCN